MAKGQVKKSKTVEVKTYTSPEYDGDRAKYDAYLKSEYEKTNAAYQAQKVGAKGTGGAKKETLAAQTNDVVGTLNTFRKETGAINSSIQGRRMLDQQLKIKAHTATMTPIKTISASGSSSPQPTLVTEGVKGLVGNLIEKAGLAIKKTKKGFSGY